jgi:hypothetical protein
VGAGKAAFGRSNYAHHPSFSGHQSLGRLGHAFGNSSHPTLGQKAADQRNDIVCSEPHRVRIWFRVPDHAAFANAGLHSLCHRSPSWQDWKDDADRRSRPGSRRPLVSARFSACSHGWPRSAITVLKSCSHPPVSLDRRTTLVRSGSSGAPAGDTVKPPHALTTPLFFLAGLAASSA